MDFSPSVLWHYKELIGFGFSGLTFIGSVKIGIDALRGGRFIAEVLSDVPVSRAQAYWRMLAAFWHAKTLMIDFKAPRLAAARYIAELEILMPDLRKPNRADYDPQDFEQVQANWIKLNAEHKKLKRDLFRSHFESRRLGVAKWIWRGFTRLLPNASQNADMDETSNIIITDIPSIDDSRDSIKTSTELFSSPKPYCRMMSFCAVAGSGSQHLHSQGEMLGPQSSQQLNRKERSSTSSVE